MTRGEFTLDEYRSYLALAVSLGYEFVGFDDLDHPGEHQIVLRHDIDYAPSFMPPMAAIEAELGVRATYCLDVASAWYSVDAPKNRAAIAETLDAGHWLGLHFDASSIPSDRDVEAGIVDQTRRLGELFSREIRVVSFHMPGRRPVGHLTLPGGLVNTYAQRFFADIGYVSDSNQNWRGVDLEQVLRERAHSRLQLLIHPFWWRPSPVSMRTKLQALADGIGVDVYEIVTPEQWQQIEQHEAAV
jgi:hypothetical protein